MSIFSTMDGIKAEEVASCSTSDGKDKILNPVSSETVKLEARSWEALKNACYLQQPSVLFHRCAFLDPDLAVDVS